MAQPEWSIQKPVAVHPMGVTPLVVGVVATILIVWMSGVKETHWDADRRHSNEKIAQLGVAVAEANARAAEANRKAEEERLSRVKLETKVAPRRLSGSEREAFLKTLPPAADVTPTIVVSRLLDPESSDFAEDLA